MLNFEFVKTVTTEDWILLPHHFKQFVKKSIENVEKRTILSEELVGLFCNDTWPILWVEYGHMEQSNKKRMDVCITYTPGVMEDIYHKDWL